MKPDVLRIAPLLTLAILGVLLVTPLLGRGEDAPTALDEYAPYLPGNPVPMDASCNASNNYYEEFYTRCRIEGGAHCEYGQIMADRGVIAHMTLYGCRFPLAYLTAQYGRYQSAQRSNHAIILRWRSVNAQVSAIGWLDNMQPVQTITWWRPVTSPI